MAEDSTAAMLVEARSTVDVWEGEEEAKEERLVPAGWLLYGFWCCKQTDTFLYTKP